jgi:hypothetical protein
MGIKDFYEVVCDNPNCNTVTHYSRISLGYLIERLRADGWAVGRNHKYCYCLKCASHYKNVGRGGLDHRRRFKVKYPPPNS